MEEKIKQKSWKMSSTYNVGNYKDDGLISTEIPEKEEGSVRIVVMSDSHCNHDLHKIPSGGFK